MSWLAIHYAEMARWSYLSEFVVIGGEGLAALLRSESLTGAAAVPKSLLKQLTRSMGYWPTEVTSFIVVEQGTWFWSTGAGTSSCC